jgi:hypothetical protein
VRPPLDVRRPSRASRRLSVGYFSFPDSPGKIVGSSIVHSILGVGFSCGSSMVSSIFGFFFRFFFLFLF